MAKAPQSNPSLVEQTRALYAKDRRLYFKNCLRIRTRDAAAKGLAPLVLNHCQESLLRLVEQIERFNVEYSTAMQAHDPSVEVSELPVGVVVLKPRKEGVSTLIEALAFHLCEFFPHTNCLVMAHQLDGAQNIAQISRRFQQAFPKEHLPIKVPMAKSSSHLEWGDAKQNIHWDSRMVIQTAKNEAVARGFDWDFVHLSEVAHFQSSDPISAARNGMRKYHYCFEESTPNGLDHSFYETWHKALYFEEVQKHWKEHGRLPDGWNGRFKFFWPWFRDPGYAMPCTEDEEAWFRENLEPEEKDLVDRHGLTMQQIKWRRHTIEHKCSEQTKMPPEDFFRQEYASTPEEAFVINSQAVFSPHRLADMSAQARDRKPEWHGSIMVIDDGNCITQESRFSSYKGSPLVLWQKPKDGHEYVMGIDTAMGLAHGDYSVASVWDRTDGKLLTEVARYHGKASPAQLANISVFLGWLYKGAYMMPEANPPGNATCQKIRELKYPWVYRRKNEEKVGEQLIESGFTEGFKTYEGTKSLLVSQGEHALRAGELQLMHPVAIREWQLYSNNDSSFGAPEGECDDCVMADLLANYAHRIAAPPVSRRSDVMPDEEDRKEWTPAQAAWSAVKKKVKRSERKHRQNRVLEIQGKVAPRFNNPFR